MKASTKLLTGAAAVAALTVATASPAQADHRWGHDDGIDAGDIITGVAVIGGIAGLIAALDGDDDRYYDRYGRYGYGYDRYGYGYGRYGYGSARSAVNVCAREAQRIGRNVQITDLDRTNRGYRVRGRIDVADYDGRGWNRRFDIDREDFTCYAAYGRIYDFRV